MNNVGPQDPFKKGEVITAKALNAVARDARSWMKVPGTFMCGAFAAGYTRRGGGTGPSVIARSNFAIVTLTAELNGGEGKAVLLDWEMIPRGPDDEEVILDPEDSGYDPVAILNSEVTFRCAHVYGACPTGARVRLSANKEIQPDSVADAQGSDSSESEDSLHVWGECVDVLDYLRTLDGFTHAASLSTPGYEAEEGPPVADPSAEDIKWRGGACPTPGSS